MQNDERLIFPVFLATLWISLSCFGAFAIVSIMDIFSPLTTGIILYLLFSCAFGVVFLPKIRDFLFYGFLLFGGLSFGPFALALSISLVFGFNPFYSVFFSMVFPSLVSFYWLKGPGEEKERDVSKVEIPAAHSVVLFAFALAQTLGFVGVLTKGFVDFNFFEALIADLSSFENLVLDLLIAVLLILVFAFFHGSLCTIAGTFRSDLKLSSRVLREGFALFPLVCVFICGAMIPTSIFLFASGSRFPYPDVVQTVGFVFLISLLAVGAGFYQMIIATTGLGLKSKEEGKFLYVFRNMMFALCTSFSVALFLLGRERKIQNLPVIQFVFIILILYEFSEEIAQKSVFYESLSQRLKIPIGLLKTAQGLIIVFVPLMAEPTDVYIYLVLLPFWILGLLSSHPHVKIPFTLKQFAKDSEFIDRGRVPLTFGWLRRRDYRRSHESTSLRNRVYSATLTGVCVGILHALNKIGKSPIAIPMFYLIFFLAIPLYIFFKYSLDVLL